MATRVLVLLGTKKGAFILESGAARETWSLRGPFCETWPMNHVIADPATGTIYGAGGNEWFGPAVWKSTDIGRDLDALKRRPRLHQGQDADRHCLEPRFARQPAICRSPTRRFVQQRRWWPFLDPRRRTASPSTRPNGSPAALG